MSKIALKLIAENKKSRIPFLNLEHCDLTAIPPGLIELEWLYVLNLSNNPIHDFSPLAQLTNLEALFCSNTNLRNLDPITNFTKLQGLDVSNTNITNLKPLGNLTDLKWLDFQGTSISDLSPLVSLADLDNINFSDTQVSDLLPIRHLIAQDLRIQWSNSCPLTNPSAEIIKQGNAAILNYFLEKETQGVDHLYEAKLLIIGEGGAGKTSLLRRLYQRERQLPEENESTKGIEIYRHEFTLKNGRTFRLNVWDFGGQEIYHATHQFFLTKRSLYILLDDTRKDYKSVHDEGFKYWLEVVDLLGSHSPILIFQNEKAGRSKTIDQSGIKSRFDNVKDFYRGDLHHPNSTDKLRQALEFYAQQLPHIGEELPAKWVAIRADIEQKAKQEPYISLDKYYKIYQQHLEFDRNKALHLSGYLHDLGVFLHFQDDPLLARTVILQNPWATEAVFKILDDEIVKARLGRFNTADCRRLWQDSVYADMHPELLALMQKFELCYRLPDQSNETWLAPQLLSPSRPVALSFVNQPDDLVLRYRYPFLPKGLISRLIVRMHRFVKNPECSWSSGALFEQNENALLAEIPEQGGEIVLRAKGPERKALLSVIAADLDALNATFHSLPDKIDKLVPCNCRLCSQSTESEFFEQKRLLQRKKDGKLTIECPTSYEEVAVLELLDGISFKQLPGWADYRQDLNTVNRGVEADEHTIKIFLASSSELKEDRDAFDLYFRQQNDELRKRGLYLQIVRWENFLDAMSETRLQDEYNTEVKNCDIFVSLFFTKTGKFTEEEFDSAHQQFKEAGKPTIYTFFNNAQVNMNDINDEVLTLLAFKKKLADLGHFYTGYDNIEHLKRQFKDQLEKLYPIN